MEQWDEWIEQNFVSPSTQRIYRTALRQFHQKFTIKTPEDLEKAIIVWTKELSSNRSPKTVRTYIAAVISYYKDQGIKIPEERWRRLRRRVIPKDRAITFDKGGTHEEWRRILLHMSIKGRSLFLFLLSTGARIGETLQLKLSDLDLNADPPRAYIRPEYTKGGYGGRVVFMTYEARDAIEEYLKTSFILKKREPKRVYVPKLKRFIDYKPPKDDDRVWNINKQTASSMLWMALKRAGLDERDPNSGRRKIHIHSTRKFFRSNCGLNDALTHALMGHEGYLDRSYLRTDPQKAGEEYKAIAMPRLTIFERHTTDKLEILKLVAKSLGVPDELIEVSIKKSSGSFHDSLIAVGNLIKQELSKSTSKKTYKIVEEENVESLLLDGWEIVKILNDGRILMASP